MKKIILPLLGICVLSATSCQKKVAEVTPSSKSTNNSLVTMQGGGPQPPQVLTIYDPNLGDCAGSGGDCLPEVEIWGQSMVPLQWWIYHRLKDIFGVAAESMVSEDEQLGSSTIREYFSETLGVTNEEFDQMNYKDFFKKLNPLLTEEQADKMFSETYTKVAFNNRNNTLMVVIAPVGTDARANPEFVLQFGTN
jgi:hypothetical protein